MKTKLTALLPLLFVASFCWGQVMFEKLISTNYTNLAWDVKQTTDNGFCIYLVKLFSNGDIEWTKAYCSGAPGNNVGMSVDVTADGGYIVCGTTDQFGAGASDVFLIKTDAAGDTLWTRTYGGADNEEG